MQRITVAALSVLMLLAAFGPAVAQAQEEAPEIIVWVNSMKAKPGQSEGLTGLLIQQGAATYDPLIASGAVLNWGVAMNVVHDGNDPSSHVEWVSFLGWEGVDQFMAAFMAAQQTMTPEEQAAMGEAFDTNVVEDSHADMINRSVAIGGATSGRPGYIHLGYFKTNPGQEGAMMEMYNSWVAPAFAKLATDGDVLAYGMHVPALHRGTPWTHMSWYSTSSLAGRSAVDKVLGGAPDPETAARMAEIFAPEHVDQILMVVHFNEAGGE